MIESKAENTIINICSGIKYTIKDVLTEIQKITDKSINIKTDDKLIRANDILIHYGDNKKLNKYISVNNKYSLNYTLTEMLK